MHQYHSPTNISTALPISLHTNLYRETFYKVEENKREQITEDKIRYTYIYTYIHIIYIHIYCIYYIFYVYILYILKQKLAYNTQSAHEDNPMSLSSGYHYCTTSFNKV